MLTYHISRVGRRGAALMRGCSVADHGCAVPATSSSDISKSLISPKSRPNDIPSQLPVRVQSVVELTLDMAATRPRPSASIPMVENPRVTTSSNTALNENSTVTSADASDPSSTEQGTSAAGTNSEPPDSSVQSAKPITQSERKCWSIPNISQTLAAILAIAMGGVGIWYMYRTDRIQVWTTKKDEREYCESLQDISMDPRCFAILSKPLDPRPFKYLAKRWVPGIALGIQRLSTASANQRSLLHGIIGLALGIGAYRVWNCTRAPGQSACIAAGEEAVYRRKFFGAISSGIHDYEKSSSRPSRRNDDRVRRWTKLQHTSGLSPDEAVASWMFDLDISRDTIGPGGMSLATQVYFLDMLKRQMVFGLFREAGAKHPRSTCKLLGSIIHSLSIKQAMLTSSAECQKSGYRNLSPGLAGNCRFWVACFLDYELEYTSEHARL
ncbi:hypothetical protein BKA65DRAFT_189310 [Rhexocercosporidium sp. MPI-PUGE-AT-0058]|nr:hypothetical protein BKA65DRAFT_189310 [Rhexocercosporidium sp. MPI-PUGE-AT-0058]